MKNKLILAIAALLTSTVSMADIQTKEVNSTYTYVSGKTFTSTKGTTVALLIEDISGGDGKCGITGGRMNTVVGATISADTVWMGLGSSAVGENRRNVYQTTVGGCLTDQNRILQSRKYIMTDNFVTSVPAEEIVTIEFEKTSLVAKSITVEFKLVDGALLYESLKADLN